jgi:pyruvate/2-oxoglutarate/acetoin dehydrogenase E1 component
MASTEVDVTQMTYAEALREGLREEMARNPHVVAYGEDFTLGYVWPVGRTLLQEFGELRIRDVPLCEQLHVGMAVGAAMAGVTSVVEVQFADFAMLAMDEIVNQAAKLCYMSGGQAKTGLVLRMVYGHLQNFGAQHSQTPYSMFTHVPGLKVATPAFPGDAKGLLKTAIRSGDPVLFFEHKRLYGVKGDVPADQPLVPFGSAAVLREGRDATVVAIGLMVHRVLEAADALEREGIAITVIDPRTLVPFDFDTVVASVRETGRLALVDEAVLRGGYTATIAADVTRECFASLRAAPLRIGVRDIPIPYSWPLETAVIPRTEEITAAIRHLATSQDSPRATGPEEGR